MEHQHTQSSLRVANVCHPAVDGRHRQRVLLEVATMEGLDRWRRRLEQTDTVKPNLAMRMLSQLETQDSVEHFKSEPEPQPVRGIPNTWWILCAVTGFLLMYCIQLQQ